MKMAAPGPYRIGARLTFWGMTIACSSCSPRFRIAYNRTTPGSGRPVSVSLVSIFLIVTVAPSPSPLGRSAGMIPKKLSARSVVTIFPAFTFWS